jgi:putative ABC transport system permease protein
MFWRLLGKLLRGSRGRLAVAIVALVSGAAVTSALINLEFDLEHKLTQEFRTLGANLVIAPGRGTEAADTAAAMPALMDEKVVLGKIEQVRTPDVVAAAPFLYVVMRAADTPVVVAGTWLDEARKLDPAWKLEGNWISSRQEERKCLVGRNVARQFQVAPGSQLELSYMGRSAQFTVAGIVDAGSAKDNQVLVNLPAAQHLAGLVGKIGLVQLSVDGTSRGISDYAARLGTALPDLEVRPIRQVTEAEGELFNRVQLLIASMVLLILILTALCVMATMAALAMERREDVGLMKALGGSITRIVGLFLAEVGVLGVVGGLIGCIAGVALSYWMGQRVFGTAISVRWEVFPLTLALMVAVALVGASPLRLLGKVKPAVILRGE